MISLLLAAALAAAPCESPEVARLPADQQTPGCQLVASPGREGPAGPSLEELYGRPGFEKARQRNSGALLALLERFRNWLVDLFESSGAATYSQVTRFIVLVLAALVAVWAATRWLRRKDEVAEVAAGALAEPLDLQPPAQHLARGRELLATDPRAAIREGLLSLLSALEEQRWARPDRVKTNQEILSELQLRGAPNDAVLKLSPLVRWYDAAWYSLEPVERGAAGRFLDEVAAVELKR